MASKSSSAKDANRGSKFWLIFASMCICLFLSALELASVSTALPTIANDLNASQFTWVGTAYALASTAFLPMSGGLAQTFGRRPTLLVTICLFAIGSAVCGIANSMNVLIAGRTIQGLGGGGIQSLSGIVLADLVPLQERGLYSGLYGIVWCIAASVGPVVGGSLAAQGLWRWLFYINLPISLVACLSVIFLLDLPVPAGNYQEKFMRLNWIGNFLVVSSTVACTMGLTWGGITAPWTSIMVLVPLVLGLVGLAVFIIYEATLTKHPLVPFSLMTNITSVSGYIQTFCCFLITFAVVYYFPVYFQACKGASPVKSGIYLLAISALAPAAVLSGLSVKITGEYRLQMWVGWSFTTVALGVMSTTTATDLLPKSIGCVALFGFGIGMLTAASMYPIQAPLSVTQNAPALAFMWFLRSFASVWGITIGSTVLQNGLAKKLPASFTQSLPHGTEIVYALIPKLSMFPARTLPRVEVAFADSLAVLWRILAVISGVGFAVSLLMKRIQLNNNVDEEWTLQNNGVNLGVVKEWNRTCESEGSLQSTNLHRSQEAQSSELLAVPV